MGSLTLAYPSIAGKTTQEQLESMRRYLCSVTEQLNLADWSAKATLTEISQAIDADSLSEAEKKTTLSGYGALKALIIKTADVAAANSETWSTKLSGSYVAISDFGKYLEKTQLTIEGNSVGIKQLYDYTAGVNNAFSVNSQQYIKTGLLYYKDAVPVYGVGVGNIETTVTDGGEKVIDRHVFMGGNCGDDALMRPRRAHLIELAAVDTDNDRARLLCHSSKSAERLIGITVS